jgi:Ca2+-binding RTX toxin-like protein
MRVMAALASVVWAAAAMTADAQITGRYATGDRVRAVHFDPSVPTGKWRNAIAKAAATWNKLPATDFQVHKTPSVPLSADACALHNGTPIGGILRASVAGALLAENRSCIDPRTGRLIGFRQTYNTRYRFHTGSGDPPRKLFDLQSVATHELGHSEGWFGDHYSGRNNSGLCANKGKQATMCPTIYPGSKRLSSLTQSDKQPVVASYAQPPIALTGCGSVNVNEPQFPECPNPRSALVAFPATVAPGGAGARGCLAGLARLIQQRRGGEQFGGGPGAQRANLGAGPDIGLGKGGGDCIVGGLGDDDLRPGPGHDTVVAGPGADIIVGGPGSDLILAGRGADQVYAADGFFDRIRCGWDTDVDSVFLADAGDVLVDCGLPATAYAAIPLPPSYLSG